jgi:type IV pilus assembly protein PilY1
MALIANIQTVFAKSPPPGSGQGDVPANILLMLDTSGSMGIKVVSDAAFDNMADVAVDSNGNFYITEYRYHRVRKFNSSGALVTTWGSYGRGNGQFRIPNGLVIDSNDNVYVSDSGNCRIQKFDSDGKFILKFGSCGSYDGRFNWPAGMGVDTSGNIYVGDFNNRRIQKFTPTGQFLLKFNNHGGPLTVTVDGNDNVYVAEYYGNKVSKYTSSGQDLFSWGGYGTADGNFRRPQAISTDSTNNVYVADTWNHRIQVFNSSGNFIRKWGSYGTTDGKFRSPFGVSVDSSGNVYVGDTGNKRVQKFNSSGAFVSAIGGNNKTRLSEALEVIKNLVSSSDLTQGANFGLLTWNSRPRLRVPVSASGAAKIYDLIANNPSSIRATGMTYIDRAMDLAARYMRSDKTPIKSSCQKNVLVVIGDGSFNGNVTRAFNIAENLANSTPSINTFVIGFRYQGNWMYTRLAEKGGTAAYSPVYSNNPQQLYDSLAKFIRASINGRMTFTSPVIAFDESGDDYILQSTFEYKKEHQWEGSLSKYKINSNGSIGEKKWNAGKKLKQTNSNSRNIWTVGSGVPSGINNFSTSNINYIQGFLYENSGTNPSDQNMQDLVNFVRGVDVYDEDLDGNSTEDRWKLADIYHSKPIVVGAPNAKSINDIKRTDTEAYYRYQKNYNSFKGGNRCGTGCPFRKEVVYVGANDGMLHAFNFKTGKELWSFIPPSMLPNLRQMISTKSNTSNSIYGVDGSPVVKDIYYGNKWRTVLLAGMGRGGHGYFALDVTNPNSPVFLFSFSNNVRAKIVNYWNSNGDRNRYAYGVGIPDEYNYSKLGEAWSTPVIMAMPYGSGRKWVAVFGAGYNSGVNTDYGSAVYVIDLEDQGKVLKKIDLIDANNNIANAVPAMLTAITPDTSSKAKYKGAMFYFADLEGKSWKLNLTNSGTLYEITQLFDAESSQENDRMEFFQVTPSIGNDGNLWMYYGTGNQQKLQRMSADIKNRIYGLKDADFPKLKAVSSSTITKLKNNTSTGGICPTSADLGWYVDLDAHEKVTGKLALSNESVFATRYTPNNKNICNPGDSKLTEHNFACGNTLRGIKLGQGIATGAVIHKGKVYVGISGSGTEDIKDEKGNVIGQRKDNLIVFTPKKGSKGKGSVSYESWREVF